MALFSSRRVSLKNPIVSAFPQPLPDGGGGVVRLNPPTRHVQGATEGEVRGNGVAPIYAGDSEGVLFSHKYVGALLALASSVAVEEPILVEALVSTTVCLIENGKGKAP